MKTPAGGAKSRTFWIFWIIWGLLLWLGRALLLLWLYFTPAPGGGVTSVRAVASGLRFSTHP
jgi:hypothetical protein